MALITLDQTQLIASVSSLTSGRMTAAAKTDWHAYVTAKSKGDILYEVKQNYKLKQVAVSLSVKSQLTAGYPPFVKNFVQAELATANEAEKRSLVARSTLVCNNTILSDKKHYVDINVASLGINWQPNTQYRFEFTEDFMRDSGVDDVPTVSPVIEFNYTTNPPIAIVSTDPVQNDSQAINNTFIQIRFDRAIRRDFSNGNIYLYKEPGTLVKAYDILNEVEFIGNSIVFETLGLLEASTSYYVLTDPGIIRDYDYLPFDITSNQTFRFTTDASANNFPDLISFEFSTASVDIAYIRYRNSNSQLNSTVYFNAVGRYYTGLYNKVLSVSASQQAVSNFTWRPRPSLLAKSTISPVINYVAGGKSQLFSNANQSSIVGVIKLMISSLNSYANLSNSFIRFRNNSSSQSAIFSQSASFNYGMLDSTRTAIPTNGTLSGGPLLTDVRGPSEIVRYKLQIVGQIPTSVSSLSVQTSANAITSSYTLTGDVVGIPGDNYATSSQFGRDVALSRDGTTLAVLGKPDGTNAGSVKIFSRSGINNWSLSKTISNITWPSVGQVCISKDGKKVSHYRTVYDYTNSSSPVTYAISFDIQSMNADGNKISTYDSSTNSVKIYTWSGSAWALEATINQLVSNEKFGYSSSLSDDGNTIAIGAPSDTVSGLIGSIYIFKKIDSSWIQQTKLQSSAGYVGDRFGIEVSISGDGKTATAGNVTSSSTNTCAVFSINSGIWTEEFLFPGRFVKLSTLGDVLISNLNIYTRYESAWSLKTTVTDAGPNYGVTIDGPGTTFAIGDSTNYFYRGAVFIYTGPGCVSNFNNSTRILTITGEKSTIKNITDSLAITKSGTGLQYLIYTATRADGFVSIRNQYV